MLPYQIIDGGSFTSDATSNKYEVQVCQRPDLIIVENRTSWGDSGALNAVRSWWKQGMAQASFKAENQDGANALSSAAGTTNGFRVYSTWDPPVYASLPTTVISKANPAVATMASTGSIQVGDVVLLGNTTGMLQISGYEFSVTAVTTNTNITLNFDGSSEAAASTAGDVKLIIPNRMYPRRRFIVPVGGLAGITQAAQCVVCMSVYHDFSVGEKVRLIVPSAYGMTEANSLVATVLSIGNASGAAYSTNVAANYNAMKLDLDTSGFSAFALPASADYADGLTPAQVVPVGAGPESGANPPGVPVKAAFDNRNEWVIEMGSNIITANSEVYDWVAYKYSKFATS